MPIIAITIEDTQEGALAVASFARRERLQEMQRGARDGWLTVHYAVETRDLRLGPTVGVNFLDDFGMTARQAFEQAMFADQVSREALEAVQATSPRLPGATLEYNHHRNKDEKRTLPISLDPPPRSRLEMLEDEI